MFMTGCTAIPNAQTIGTETNPITNTETSSVIPADTGEIRLSEDAKQLSGKWQGNMKAVIDLSSGSRTTINTEVDLNINLNGNQVNGSWQSKAGNSGTLDGIVKDSNVEFALKQNKPCPGTLLGTGTVKGSSIDYFFKGSDCEGTYQEASGVVQKVN